MRNRLSQISTEAEYAREYQKENDQLRTEICVMHERLRRLDPSMPHIYGQYTSQLTQQQHSHANGQAPHPGLPPMGHPPQHHYAPMPPPPGAMQGVEYGAPPPRSSYEMR